MKEVYRNDDVAAYTGLKDFFGGKMYVVINNTLNTLHLYSKYKDYKKKRKLLDDAGHTNVWTPEWGEVIDINRETLRVIQKEFTGYNIPTYKWQVWD